eukprot:jgi/Tetstr1/422648/TSEL_013453.t1
MSAYSCEDNGRGGSAPPRPSRADAARNFHNCMRTQHATLSDAAGAFLSEPSGASSPHSLYLAGASSIYLALATPTLAPDAGANVVSAPMWAVELRAANTCVVDGCGDAVLEDLTGPLASALKLLLS